MNRKDEIIRSKQSPAPVASIAALSTESYTSPLPDQTSFDKKNLLLVSNADREIQTRG